MNKTIFIAISLFAPVFLFSQQIIPASTAASERLQNSDKRQAMLEQSLVKNVPFKSIGPSVFSGRVADVDVWPEDPTHFYVAYASGGLWKTENNGQSFAPLFDNEVVMTIGDIAVDWQNNTVWVGTGEVNSSRSSYSGVGIFKSTNGGKTWQHKGLPESHHIGRVLIHPTDPNTVWVAVLGHLYSSNKERGIFKTTDGGDTWNKVLFVDENSGAIDLVLDPQNSNILYAATWQRERRAWDFVESGEGSGIYKSEDGGNNWTLLSTSESGFPTGKGAGRIGLDAAVKNGKTILVAVIDNQNRRPKEDEKEEGLNKDQLREMDKEAFLKLEEPEIETYLKDNNFPKKYTAKKVSKMIRKSEIKPAALAEYLDNANSQLFDTPVMGAEVYSSEDGGLTWTKTHEGYLDDVYYSYGYYFGQIRVAKQQPEKLYIFGVPILVSEDSGKTWQTINSGNVHSDHHALWIDPARDGHLILGNDGGINISYDDGENWVKCNTPPLGQFYHIAVDMEEPYNVYGGLQDNGSWYGPHTYKASNRWHANGHYPYKSFVGGDGMQTAVDTRDNNTIYGGFQFGFYYRINKKTGKKKRITPRHDLGKEPYRWNWQTPIHLSIHNQDILYMGGNKLFRSMNQGDDWKAISPDLTKGGKKGDVPFGTISAIHESPLKFGLLYAGTDDGLLHVSKDGGNTWADISAGLPNNLWVSRVQASKHEKGRVYVSLNGYRWDNFNPYIFVSENYGETWQQLGKDLPLEPVNVIKEDPVNADLLYVGTDHGLYVSLDRGGQFMVMNEGLPSVPVHDVVVHPTSNDLIVGTHGRSLYLADASVLQELKTDLLAKEIHAFDLDKIKYADDWGDKKRSWDKEYKEPKIKLVFYAKKAGSAAIKINVGETQLKSWDIDLDAGLNYIAYHADFDPKNVKSYEKLLNEGLGKGEEKTQLEAKENGRFYLQPGAFKIVIEKGNQSSEILLKIEEK